MRVLIEKIFLLLCHTALFFDQPTFTWLVCAACYFILDLAANRWIKLVCYTVFLVGICFLPQGLSFATLLIYDIFVYRPFLGLLCAGGLCLAMPTPSIFVLAAVTSYLAWRATENHAFVQASYEQLNHLALEHQQLSRSKQLAATQHAHQVEVATLTERNRIAQQLHNDIGHSISSAILQLEALQVTTPDAKKADQLAAISEQLQDGMTTIRTTLHQLYGSAFNLDVRLQELCQHLDSVAVTLNYSVDSDLPIAVKHDVLTAAKELLTNFTKHSNGTHVRLKFIEQATFYTLQYQDNGTDTRRDTQHTGIGLLGLRELATHYGGHLTIDTQHGFSVTITLQKSHIEGGTA